MEKNIKDFLHLYLGCECVVSGSDGTSKITIDGVWKGGVVECNYNDVGESSEFPGNVKPILRPLSDMTDEEYAEILPLMPSDEAIDNDDETEMLKAGGELNRWLLSHYFDLFGLIESGLAIDKTKLSTHAPS